MFTNQVVMAEDLLSKRGPRFKFFRVRRPVEDYFQVRGHNVGDQKTRSEVTWSESLC